MKPLQIAKQHQQKITPAILFIVGLFVFGPAISGMPGLLGAGYESLFDGIKGEGSLLDQLLGNLWVSGSLSALTLRGVILMTHIFNAALVAHIARRISVEKHEFWVSLIAGLVFLIAPMQINSIALTDQIGNVGLTLSALLITVAIIERQSGVKTPLTLAGSLFGLLAIRPSDLTTGITPRLETVRSTLHDATQAIPEAFFHPGAVNNPNEQLPILGIATLILMLFVFSIVSSKSAKKSSKTLLILTIVWLLGAMTTIQPLYVGDATFIHPAAWYAFIAPLSILTAWSFQHWELRYLRVALAPVLAKSILSIGIIATFALATSKNTQPFITASSEAEKIVTVAAEETQVDHSQTNYLTNVPYVIQSVPTFHRGLPEALAVTQARNSAAKTITEPSVSIQACKNERQFGVIHIDGANPTYSITAKQFPSHIKAQAESVDVLSWEGEISSFRRSINIEKARE